MSGRQHGSDWKLFLFQGGEPVDTVELNTEQNNPRLESKDIQRQGTTRTEPEVQGNGWEIQGNADKASFAWDDFLEQQLDAYYNGQPVDRIEAVQVQRMPHSGASRTYRYFGGKITDYQESHSGQNDPTEISLTVQFTRREKV